MSEVQIKIEAYDPINAKMDELRELANFIPDASTKEGYEKSKSLAKDIRKVEINLEKARKAEKDYFLKGGKAVDSQAKDIQSKLVEIKQPHYDAYIAIDNAEKEAKKRRMDQAQEKIDAITCLVDKSEFADSKEIADFIEMTDMFNPDDGLYELTGEGLMAKQRVMKTLTERYEAKKTAEKEAAELEILRKEKEEREQKEREELIAKQASEKAEREKLEAIEREERAQQAAIDAENARIAQEKQAKIDAENAKIEAEKQAKQAAENARLAEIARQEAEEKRKADELAKLEANKKHVGEICKQSKEDLMLLGLSEEQAKKVVKAIAKKEVRNINIQY